ncbi:MAG: hypothetical protein ACTSRA_21815, partial [Promethearchaeota archaeon]
MDGKLFYYDENKESFTEIDKFSSDDVVFIVVDEVHKVFVWQGKNSSRLSRYKCGMKAPTLISMLQLYGYKHEVLTEGEEPSDLKGFISQHLGTRDLSFEDIAKQDRDMVVKKAKAISRKYQGFTQVEDEGTLMGNGDTIKKEEPTDSAKEKDSIGERAPSQLSVGQAGMDKEKETKTDLAEPVKKIEDTKTTLETPVPDEPNKKSMAPDAGSEKVKSMDEEIDRMVTRIGAEMVVDDMSAEKKKFLTKEEREILEKVQKEQMRAENIMGVEEIRLKNEEKRIQRMLEDQERFQAIQEEKIKKEAAEQLRIERERQLLAEKLQKEKERMMAERKALEAKIRQEELERKNQLEALQKIRKEQEKNKVEFELRKIDLKVQLRRKGVDYIKEPQPGKKNLYRINKGVAELVEDEVLTTADVYLLDKGDSIYVWKGTYSTIDEQFFGEQISKMLKDKRGGNVQIKIIEQDKEPLEFFENFESLKLIDGNYSDSILKRESISDKENFILYRIKTEAGLIFREVPPVYESITSDDSFIIDFGDQIYVFHGRDSNP